jgi:hypothetical protein
VRERQWIADDWIRVERTGKDTPYPLIATDRCGDSLIGAQRFCAAGGGGNIKALKNRSLKEAAVSS